MTIGLCWQKKKMNISQDLLDHGTYNLIRNKWFSYMKMLTM